MKSEDLQVIAAAAEHVREGLNVLATVWPHNNDVPASLLENFPFTKSLREVLFDAREFATVADNCAKLAERAERRAFTVATRTILYQKFKVTFETEDECDEAIEKYLGDDSDVDEGQDDPEHIAHVYAMVHHGANLSRKFKVGDRVKLSRYKEIMRDGVRPGEVGTVTEAEGDFIVKFDKHLEILDEWDNEIIWVDADLYHNDGPDTYLEVVAEPQKYEKGWTGGDTHDGEASKAYQLTTSRRTKGVLGVLKMEVSWYMTAEALMAKLDDKFLLKSIPDLVERAKEYEKQLDFLKSAPAGTVVDGWYSAIWIVVVDASLPTSNIAFGGGMERPEIGYEDEA